MVLAAGIVAVRRSQSDDHASCHRSIALAGASLAGCSSSSRLDSFKSAPPSVQVQLRSVPPGADAKTSAGPGCKTPCQVSVPAGALFTVTFTLNRFQPATVPVQVINDARRLFRREHDPARHQHRTQPGIRGTAPGRPAAEAGAVEIAAAEEPKPPAAAAAAGATRPSRPRRRPLNRLLAR